MFSPLVAIGFYRKFVVFIFLLSIVGCQKNRVESIYKDAILQWKEGSYEDAVQNFIFIFKSNPESMLADNSLYHVATIYHFYLNEINQASKHYKLLINSYKDSEFYIDANRKLASIYSTQKKEGIEKAVLIYEKFIHQNLNGANINDIYFEAAELYLDINDYTKARAILKQGIETYEEIFDVLNAYYVIGFSYYLEGNIQLAIKSYEEAFNLAITNKNKAFFLEKMASLLEEQGTISNSIKLYTTFIEQIPTEDIFYPEYLARIEQLKQRLKEVRR